MAPSLLLQRYRRDRRNLLEFIISASGLSHPPLGADELDTVSVDHVLDRVQSGGALDVSEATNEFFDEIERPNMIYRSSGNLYFVLTKPESSGSPPQRSAPQAEMMMSNHSLSSKKQADYFVGREVEGKTGTGVVDASVASSKPTKDTTILSLGLPSLSTVLSDDDIRETAYEVLLASIKLSSGSIHLFQERKQEKKPLFLKGLRSKRGGLSSRQPEDSHSHLLDMIRIQMEIPEALEICTKQGLRHLSSGLSHDLTDVPQISLALLGSICKSDFLNDRLYTQWKKRQANVLEELLCSASLVADGHTTLGILFSNLRNKEEWGFNIGPEAAHEILMAIKKHASRFSSLPGKFGIPRETCYWTSSYHFNIRLYEKLLFSVFDVLEDGQVIEEEEEFLLALKLTWHILGIRQRMHNALYGWVLFQQFIQTGEPLLLKLTVREIRKVLSYSDVDQREEAYVNNLTCSAEAWGSKRDLNLVDAIFSNVYMWCSCQLEDYHLHFGQGKSVTFESVLTLAVLSGSRFANDCKEIKYIEPKGEIDASSKLLHIFIERSTHAAYIRVLDVLDSKSKESGKHPLALLANDLKLISETESIAFTPFLCRQYPEAGMLSLILLHQLYREQLEPFLDGVSDFSEAVRSVLAESNSLECCLFRTLHSISGESLKSTLLSYLHPYQISHICAPLILHWVNAQHGTMLECTKRAIHIEDWKPISSQRRHGASIIEVFRIIEEAIEQFFNLKLPMDIIHLRCLLIGIVRSLEAYLQDMVSHRVDKNTLYPSRPALTRYKGSVNPLMKKKPVEHRVLEEKVISQLNHLTASKLCVKLNTLHYIRDQLDMLEDSIKQSWFSDRPVKCEIFGASEENLSTNDESVEEIFTIFDDIKRSTFDVSDIIFDFIGTRVIFWDMKDSFLLSVYRGSVERARLEICVPELDAALDHICGLIVDTLRDKVVLSICRASMDGYVWLMLDGGPSRVFSESDISMMQEDLNTLKELFVANGEGLPSDAVEKEATVAQKIIDLYSLKPDLIIEMLINATRQIDIQPSRKKPGSRCAKEADTLLRILCHNKNRGASRFLKKQYQLPKSSDYDDDPAKEQTSESTFLADILGRNTSFDWSVKGQRSFRVIMKKFQEATS